MRKVSAVVADGTYNYYDGGVVYEGSGQTALSGWLSPPTMPPYVGGVQLFFGWTILITASLVAVGAVAIGVTNWNAEDASAWRAGLVTFLLSCPWFALGLYMIVIGPQRRRPQVVLQRQAWRQALGYWRRLFYCFRCDVVFVPGHGQFAQRTEMYDFVYRLGSAFSQGAADLGTCLLDLEDLPAGFVIAWCADYSTRMVALDSDDPVATQQLLQQQGRLSSPIVSYLKEPSLRTPFSGEVGVTDQLIEYRTVGHAQQRVVPLSNEACARGYERLQMHQLGDQSVALRKTAGNTVAFRMIVRCGRFVALIDCWGKRRRMSESHAFRFAKAAADRLAMVRATARPYQRDFDDIFGNARFSSGGIRVGSSNL